MRHLNEFLNEKIDYGKYFDEWSDSKYLKIKNGRDIFELIGDPKVKGWQEYRIMKNGKQVGTFDYDSDSYSFWITAPSLKKQLGSDNIDGVVDDIKKHL